MPTPPLPTPPLPTPPLPTPPLPTPPLQTPSLPGARAISAALSRAAYDAGVVRSTGLHFAGADCLVASRQGVFAVGRAGLAVKVLHGFFFGIRLAGNQLYLFEACDRPYAESRRGRIVRLRRDGDALVDPVVLADGLDTQGHQLALFDESLWLVDTRNQRIVQFALDGTETASRMPVPLARGDDPRGGYAHVNGLARIGGRIALMLHNGAGDADTPSELAWFDRDWHPLRRDVLPGLGCHDIVADGDGVIWHCASLAGEVFNSAGLRWKVGGGMTRGLAVTADTIVVGVSEIGPRALRETLVGAVLFLDRDGTVRASVALPAAPTDLVML